MLQQEFQALTGLKVSDSAYKQIEEMYMNVGMEKQDFCKDFKKHGESTIMVELFDKVQKLNRVVEGMEKTFAIKAKMEHDMADYLIEQSSKWSVSDLREKAIEMLGAKEYLRRKLEMGLSFWEADKELLKEILSE